MSLGIPANQFRELAHNLQATPSTTGPGTTLTASATIHTKGNFVDLLGPLSFDVYSVSCCVTGVATSAAQTSMLIDLAIHTSAGAAGSVGTIIIPDMLASSAPNAGDGPRILFVDLPLFIPKGSVIRARIQALIASDTCIFGIWCRGGSKHPPWPLFSGADAYGISTATSNGTSITAGNTGAEGTWTSVGSTTTRPYSAILPMGVGQAGSATITAGLGYHYEIGYSSTTFGEFYFRTDSTERIPGIFPPIPIYQRIPSGTQLQARGECSGTAQAHDIALYGLY